MLKNVTGFYENFYQYCDLLNDLLCSSQYIKRISYIQFEGLETKILYSILSNKGVLTCWTLHISNALVASEHYGRKLCKL